VKDMNKPIIRRFGFSFFAVESLGKEENFMVWLKRDYSYHNYRFTLESEDPLDSSVKPLAGRLEGKDTIYLHRLADDLYLIEFNTCLEFKGCKVYRVEEVRELDEEEEYEYIGTYAFLNGRYFTLLNGEDTGNLIKRVLRRGDYKLVLF
jgi:hypothetical protein